MTQIRRAQQRHQTSITQGRRVWLRERLGFQPASSISRQKKQHWSAIGALFACDEGQLEAFAGSVTHCHQATDLVTLVLSGALEQRDSSSALRKLRAGQLQHIDAAAGVVVTEYNGARGESTRLLRLSLQKMNASGEASQQAIEFAMGSDGWQLLIAPKDTAPEGLVPAPLEWSQPAVLRLARLDAEAKLALPPAFGQGRTETYLYVIEGEVAIADSALVAGDAFIFSSSEAGIVEQEILAAKSTQLLGVTLAV